MKVREEKKLNYLFKDIPRDVWQTAQVVCAEMDITFKELLIRAIKDFCTSYYIQGRTGKTV